MATALPSTADSALQATDEKANFQRLTRLLVCGGITLLKDVFDVIHPPATLPTVLKSHKSKLGNLKNQNFIYQSEWSLLYPSPGVYGNSTEFDITLLFKLFRSICNLTQPVTGWDKLPNSTDLSREADLVRIKFYRNEVYGHSKNMEISDAKFVHLWREISEALLRIAGSLSVAKRDEWEKSIAKFLRDPLTPDAVRSAEELQLWYKKDMDVKDGLENLKTAVEQLTINVHIMLESRKPDASSVSPGHLPNVQQLQVAEPACESVRIPIPEEQLQAGGQLIGELQTSQQNPPDIWNVILSFRKSFNVLIEYLRIKLGLDVVDVTQGSLVITVSYSSLQVLEGLWADYQSRHLSEVVQETLVTAELLNELGHNEVKLKAIILEEDYNRAFEELLGTIYIQLKKDSVLLSIYGG